MMNNNQVLNHLFETGQIDLKRGAIFDMSPGTPQGFDFGRIEGMMLGLAVGDALGNTSESMLPEQRHARYGEIRDYLPNRHADNRQVGLPSDDTQMAFWTLDQMVADGEFKPERVAERFCRGEIFGIGGTVKGFIANYKAGLDWYCCGPKSAGNGALMRIAPMLIPYIGSGSSDVWVDTALSAMMTHNDSASTAACLSFVHMLWRLLLISDAPAPDWWLETYVAVAQELECDESYRPRDGAFTEYQGPLWRFVQDKVSWAYRQGLSVREACDLWHSGAFLLETVPSVLFILMRHGDNLEEAIVKAVNDTKDNDTIAAIVGAAVGALYGRQGIPSRWLSNLLGRTSKDDDGQVFHILERARNLWWA